MQLAAGLVLFSVLVPSKSWFPPNQPILVTQKSESPVAFVLTDFTGKVIETKADTLVVPNQTVDLRALYPAINSAGTYILFAVPKAKSLPDFVGTPLVIESRGDNRPGAPAEPMVSKVEPLCYASLTTEQGVLTIAFYYDAAPDTVCNFLTLAREGFYDGLTFHRIVPGFVIQGGDPRGNGTGGPGYEVAAEFNDRRHELGVVSMARNADPLERQGEKPRPEYANSAGSQFFICLGRAEQLDGRYTAFGMVVRGNQAVRSLEALRVADARTGRPETPPVIKSIRVVPVTAADNPYLLLLGNLGSGESEPATRPAR